MIPGPSCHFHSHPGFLQKEKHGEVTTDAGLFLLRPANSTGNDKSAEQQQYGSTPQLLPLSEFPEGQKEFSSQLRINVLHLTRHKLWENQGADEKLKSDLS